MKFKLKPGAGKHKQVENGKEVVYLAKEGRIIHSDVNLAEVFIGKFDVVGSAVSEPELVTQVPVAQEAEKEPTDDVEQEQSPFGNNVTSDFDKAVLAFVQVFEKDGAYFVVSDDENETILNDKPLKSEHATKMFIAKMVKGA